MKKDTIETYESLIRTGCSLYAWALVIALALLVAIIVIAVTGMDV